MGAMPDSGPQPGTPKGNPNPPEARTTCTLAGGESQVLHLNCPFKPETILPDPDVKVLQLRRNVASAKF
jgi:hypothetical protein